MNPSPGPNTSAKCQTNDTRARRRADLCRVVSLNQIGEEGHLIIMTESDTYVVHSPLRTQGRISAKV